MQRYISMHKYTSMQPWECHADLRAPCRNTVCQKHSVTCHLPAYGLYRRFSLKRACGIAHHACVSAHVAKPNEALRPAEHRLLGWNRGCSGNKYRCRTHCSGRARVLHWCVRCTSACATAHATWCMRHEAPPRLLLMHPLVPFRFHERPVFHPEYPGIRA